MEIEALKPQTKPRVLIAVCHGCKKQHPIEVDPTRYSACFDDWVQKHSGENCNVEFRLPRQRRFMMPEARRWMDYIHNADIKISYASSAAYTITLASLASDTNLLAGRESTAISNTSNLYVDYWVGGKATTGTSPTDVRKIEVWAYAAVDGTPTYPDVFDGTDSDETVTSANIKNGALALLAILATSNTSDRTYWMKPTSLVSAFGFPPANHGIFVTHNTGVNFNSTAGNHAFSHRGMFYTSS